VGVLAESSEGSPAKEDVVTARAPGGALSLELMPVDEGVARGFLRVSPRNMKLSSGPAAALSKDLSSRGYSEILVQDSSKKTLSKGLVKAGWEVDRAIPGRMTRKCRLVTTFDLPLDGLLIDSDGNRPDVANSSNMRGIMISEGGRKAWAYYTDDGETARVVTEKERRLGMLVASDTEDLFEAAECLVRYLASIGKSWVVFSVDLGRFVRRFRPMMMVRMLCDRPRPFDHSAKPLGDQNRRQLVRLFSEYYDESTVESMLRLRRFRSDPSYSMFLVDGGFVIVKVEGETGLVYDIYVTPSQQGSGLGKELMRCALTSLNGRVSSVYLHTSYPRAKRLYDQFGFKAVYSSLGIRLDELAFRPPRAHQTE
jgi:ribosomal protein S18 acetylase RimI-like enzyme